jgi:Asp-tRNA(Asn)/Glu-tRNA(Gln) amidotransferase A subunit family amidase
MEFDLARLRGVSDPDAFLAILDGACAATLTSDFWSITLPNDLATSVARSPSMFAYYAALNVLDARALYSRHTVRELMEPSIQALRSALERHHLFPIAELKRRGVTEQRDYNQIANFTVVEWGDNAKIAASAPTDYVPELEARFSAATLNQMYEQHALPAGWENLDYFDFLRLRRSLMAQTIRAAYERLSGDAANVPASPSVQELVLGGESSNVEFKSTLRTNLHTGQRDAKMEFAVVRTVAGFLNTFAGGTLIVGVADDGTPVGIDVDGFPNEDKMALHLVNLLKDRIGGQHAISIHPKFDDYENGRALVVDCKPAKAPAFVKDGSTERFFVRYGPSTQELSGSQAQEFIRQRFV